MDNFYCWHSGQLNVFFSIGTVVIGFSTYWFISQSSKIKSWFFKNYEGDNVWIRYVLFQRIIGMIFMGILPGLLVLCFSEYSLTDLGMQLGHFNMTLSHLLLFGPILACLGYFISKNRANREVYPQIRLKTWTPKTHVINILSWAGYLLMYEFMYRGLLLFPCVDAFGFWPAVAINLAYYSTTHIAKGLGETIGTIPYGLVLCFVTVASGSIAFAFISHLILALSNDLCSLHHRGKD